MLSVPISIVLLVVYVVVTMITLRRHADLHAETDTEETAGWSLRTAIIVLTAATVVTAFVAETLVHTLEVFARRSA